MAIVFLFFEVSLYSFDVILSVALNPLSLVPTPLNFALLNHVRVCMLVCARVCYPRIFMFFKGLACFFLHVFFKSSGHPVLTTKNLKMAFCL